MWYVAETKPGKLPLAQQHLKQQHYDTFVPQTHETTIHPTTHQKQHVLKPLFPGYIFIELNLKVQNWTPINNTRGIRHLLTGASKPTVTIDDQDDFGHPIPIPIHDRIITALLARPILYLDPGPHPGDRVKILSSVFQNETALIDSIQKNRVHLILDTYRVPISVHRNQIEALHDGKGQERALARS